MKNVGVGEHNIGLVDMNSEIIVSKWCRLTNMFRVLKSLGGYLGLKDIPGYILPSCNNSWVQCIAHNIYQW